MPRAARSLALLLVTVAGCSAAQVAGDAAPAVDTPMDIAVDLVTPPADATVPTDATAPPTDAAAVDAGLGCAPVGTPGPLCDAGAVDAGAFPTGTYTWWSFASPTVTRLEWTVDIDRRTAGQGYFWSHEFYFVHGGGGGYIGIQDNGDFQASASAPTEVTQMVLFSVAGGALQAELGDFPSPNGSALPGFDGPVQDAYSIHVKFPWSPCVPYRFVLETDGTDAMGNTWLKASITDPTVPATRVIGRILTASSVGGIQSGTVMWTEHWAENNGVPLANCGLQAHGSAVFGTPIANGTESPTHHTNDFSNPTHCPTSRFTEVPGGVRQEMGVGGP